ncbi:tape measure protein [Pectobacterium brasiliense]|uniref:tape measure protein n=1 Tax=Pectobacterium brasiliense TaxID=180957 RepID=UPI000689EE66|nr:tape measure protein [Pectobacterium brasiliense]
MASENQVGNIVYQVEMDVAKLIEAQRQVDSRLDKMEEGFNKSAKSADRLEASMSKLGSVIKGVFAVSALREMAGLVQRFQEMSERVQMATASQEEFEHVQQRLLKTANGTYRALSEAQELYITTAASLRSMNYTTDQAIDIQDSMSYAFVKNATSVDRANNAISAFSKSINKGKVEADSWETIIAAIPSVIDDIAAASGKSSAEIRALGSAGKITAAQLSEGLRQSLEENSAAAAGMSNNLTDAGVRMKTAITSLLVAMEKETGALQAFTNGIISAADGILGFSQNTQMMPKVLDAVAISAGIVAAVMASRYVGAMQRATAENIKHAASSLRVVAAQGAMATAVQAGKFALSLVGGPAGAAMLAATAIFYFYQKSQQAREEAIAFADSVDKLNASMRSMSNTSLRGAIGDSNQAIRGMQDAIIDAKAEIDDLSAKQQRLAIAGNISNAAMQRSAEVTDQLGQKRRDLADLEEKLSRVIKARDDAQITLNNNMLTSMGMHDNLIQKGTTLERVQGAVAKAFGNTADEINRANQAGQNFNPKNLQVSPATAEGDKFILSLQEQNELLKIQDDRLRAVTKAGMEQAKVTDNKNQIAAAKQLAGENFDLQKAQEERRKEQQKAEQQDKSSASTAQSIALKLENMKQQTQLATSATENLSREQAILRAQQSLGKGATEDNIRLAGEYAAAQWDAARATQAATLVPALSETQSYRSDIQALQAALNTKKITQEEYYAAVEQREQQHQANMAKIISDAAVTPTQQAVAQVDPVQALANEHTRKLALIQQFEKNTTLTHDQAIALRNAADKQYEQQRIAANWEIWRNQNIGNEAAAASFDAFAGSASNALTGIISGSMSASQAMQSLGNTVLNSLINTFVQMGAEWVRSAVMGSSAQIAATTATTTASVAGIATTTAASTAAAGTTMTAWLPAALVASIGSFGAAAVVGGAALLAGFGLISALSGKRKNGGPVSAGGMYQVGESGLPEIYRASDGKQYMIPGDNGSVISNKDLGSGGGGNVVVNVNNYTSSEVKTQSYSQDGSTYVDVFINDMESGGPMANTLQSTFGLSRRANGAY